MHELSDEERRRIAASADYFLSYTAQRHGISVDDVIDTIRWVRERKEFAQKIKSTGTVSLIGLLVSALALAVWEGLKSLLSRSGN
jgi:hypothetical protein